MTSISIVLHTNLSRSKLIHILFMKLRKGTSNLIHTMIKDTDRFIWIKGLPNSCWAQGWLQLLYRPTNMQMKNFWIKIDINYIHMRFTYEVSLSLSSELQYFAASIFVKNLSSMNCDLIFIVYFEVMREPFIWISDFQDEMLRIPPTSPCYFLVHHTKFQICCRPMELILDSIR